MDDLRYQALNDAYKLIRLLGTGTFGEVWLAEALLPQPKLPGCAPYGCAPSVSAPLLSPETSDNSVSLGPVVPGRLVAVKTLKMPVTAAPAAVRELSFFMTMPPHPSLVLAYDLFMDPASCHATIVMESMEMDLGELIRLRSSCGEPFAPNELRPMLRQIVTGLKHIHSYGVFHRDIKPQNILVSSSGFDQCSLYSDCDLSYYQTYTLKLADFGLSRHYRCADPFTSYVSTRWYRAPELLLPEYPQQSLAVDMWALGCVAYELVHLVPLFPGDGHFDQVIRVISIVGLPHAKSPFRQKCREYMAMAPYTYVTPHRELVPPDHEHLNALVRSCLQWDAYARITASEALVHPYFA